MTNRTLDMIIIDIDRNREQLVLRVGSSEIKEVLRMRDLGIQPLHFLLRLDALVQIRPAVIIKIQNLILTFETGDLRLLGTQVSIQLSYTVINEIGSLTDNLLLLLNRILVVDGNHLIQDISRTLRRGIVQ